MRPHARRKAYTVLLLMTMALLASGCASDGGTYSQTQVGVGVYGAGYYGAYPGYYHGDVIVGAPLPPPGGVYPPGGMPPPGGVRPPGGMPPPGGAPPPHVSQMPARPLPAPAPRPMPAGGGMRGGGGRR